MTIAIKKHYKNMREKYKIISSSTPNNINLANRMLSEGYKLFNIVPHFFSDGGCMGYTYWFEDISQV